MHDDVAAFILAGGKSTRMGRDKAFVSVDGQTLIERMLDLAKSVTHDVQVVGNPEKFSQFAPTIEDAFPECGPLGGIHAALRSSAAELNVILAVDMPYVSTALLQYLIARARHSHAIVTVARGARGYQPVCAVYRRAFVYSAETALIAGRYKIDELFTAENTQVIEESELQGQGFSDSLFRNLNTPQDLHEAPGAGSPKPEAGSRDIAPYIEFRDVSKSFGDNHVLKDVSFNVMPAETVCILGRSGVGKSVALQHIMGFLKPDSGRVIVASEDITDYTEEQLEPIRKKATMVFQNGALFDSLTVGENVAFPLRENQELTEEQIYQVVDGLLDMVGVKHMRDLLPSDLSTGMKRSVAIARALAARPECILYDEPTTMVDPLMAQLLGDLIKRLKGQLNLTSIVVTHDMRLAKKVADRVVFLYEAKAIFFGPYSEMEKSKEPIIQEFLELDELKIEA
jgi:phospholipid/cholesterol/gamma-HCH transport system ATP-binding protein